MGGREGESPGRVVVEGRGGEPKQQPLLVVVQDPEEVPVRGGWRRPWARRPAGMLLRRLAHPADRPEPGGSWPCSDKSSEVLGEIAGRDRRRRPPRDSAAARARQGLAAGDKTERGSTVGLGETPGGGLPAPEALLDAAGGARSSASGRGPPQAHRIRRERRGHVPDELLVVSERELDLRPLRGEPRARSAASRAGVSAGAGVPGSRSKSVPARAAPRPATNAESRATAWP